MARQREKERGAIAVLAALLVMVLGGFLALSLDLGHKFSAKGQLEAAADGAAMTAARAVDGTTNGLFFAHKAAGDFASQYKIDKTPVAIDSNFPNASTGDVVAGFWDTNLKKFFTDGQTITLGDSSIVLSSNSTPQYFNAVKVTTAADGALGHNAPLDVFFGFFVGFNGGLMAKASTIALGGGPCDENNRVIPFVIPSCAMADSNGNNMCGQVVNFSFNWGGGRDIAFADITIADGSEIVHDYEVAAQITSALNNTTPFTAAFNAFAISDGLGNGADDGIPYGGTPPGSTVISMLPVCGGTGVGCPTYVVPVVNIGTDCGARMPIHATPVGFTQVSVVGIPTWTTANRTISLYFNCTNPSNQRPGCADFGLPSQYRPQLVK